MFIDLTHTFEDGMPGFRMRGPEGEVVQYSAAVSPFLTHADSEPFYDGKASFEITEVTFQTSIGTYLDAPRHRFPDRHDIADYSLENLVLPGCVIDVTQCKPERSVMPDDLPSGFDPSGKAVLFRFGWDRYWGHEAYFDYPFIGRDVLTLLRDGGAELVGVDTLNIDDSSDPERPAHTWFLDAGIRIVENLCHLDKLPDRDFRFFAVPLPVRGAAAFPIRAFAEFDIEAFRD